MFRTPIILIDDDPTNLDQLNRAFALSGQPCLPILYDRNNPNNQTGIDHVTSDTRHARIIALDINLRESQNPQDAKILYPTIEKVLEKLNPAGPYYLIFWSKYKELPSDIFNLLSQRSQEIITAPIGWGFLDKTDFQSVDSSNELKSKLIEIIDEVKIFKLLLEWEDRTSRAASHTLSELYKIAATYHNKGWNLNETKEKLTTLLTHIAHESVGHKNAKDAANHAVETGLMSILEDNLLTMTSNSDIQRLNDEWKACLNNLGNRKSLDSLSKEDISNLNTFYNLEEVTEEFAKCKRGVFVKLSDNIKNDTQSFQSQFGTGNCYKNLVTEEFLFNTDAGDKTYRTEARNNITLGWLEVGAACDHAQGKNRLHRYLLSALVPAEYSQMVCNIEGNNNKAHEGIYRSPLLMYKNKSYVLLVTFRYTTGLHGDSHVLDTPLFRLKEQIVNEIAFAWGKHSIRPGITSFRE